MLTQTARWLPLPAVFFRTQWVRVRGIPGPAERKAFGDRRAALSGAESGAPQSAECRSTRRVLIPHAPLLLDGRNAAEQTGRARSALPDCARNVPQACYPRFTKIPHSACWPGAEDLKLRLAELGPDGAELSSASSSGPPPPPPPVHLDAAAVQRLYLGTDLLHAVLPNRTVVQDWQPYQLLPSNVDILLKKDIDWVVDDEDAPSVASLCTFPIRVPIGDDWYYLNIDMFGKDLSQVRRQYLAHLRRHTAGLRGSVMCQLFLEPALWAPMVELCRSVLRVELVKEYTDQCVVESDVV
ncbi:unnamed protein product [Arctogadus glacialis]